MFCVAVSCNLTCTLQIQAVLALCIVHGITEILQFTIVGMIQIPFALALMVPVPVKWQEIPTDGLQ